MTTNKSIVDGLGGSFSPQYSTYYLPLNRSQQFMRQDLPRKVDLPFVLFDYAPSKRPVWHTSHLQLASVFT